MKRIAFLAIDKDVNGDGMGNKAFWDEKERDLFIEKNHRYEADEIILDTEKDKKEAEAKLTAVDKLVLGLNGPQNAIRG